MMDFVKLHKAWDYLNKAIDFEAAGKMSMARMSLAQACSLELQAYGFVSTASDMVKTIEVWMQPITTLVPAMRVA